MKTVAVLLLACTAAVAATQQIDTVHLKPAPDMTRAEIHFAKTGQNSNAALVLCTGHNGDGMALIKNKPWQEFASKYGIGLLSISFASEYSLLEKGRGYAFADRGSGQIVLDAVRKHYGKDLPLLLYGFSSGALFVEQFANWKPDRVKGWAAHATGWCGQQTHNDVPGLISCGELDASRYGGAIVYFKTGRAQGKRLLWLSLPNLSHATSNDQEEFARRFLSSVLEARDNSGRWVDVDRRAFISEQEAAKMPSLSGWLPNETLFAEWKRIHSP